MKHTVITINRQYGSGGRDMVMFHIGIELYLQAGIESLRYFNYFFVLLSFLQEELHKKETAETARR